MKKEIIICIIIIITIIIGNIITQNYSQKTFNDLGKKLEILREDLVKEDVEKILVNERISEIENIWKNVHNKLAIFIEHEELEKTETSLAGLKSYTEMEEYADAVEELDKMNFLMEHIEDKNKYILRNIF